MKIILQKFGLFMGSKWGIGGFLTLNGIILAPLTFEFLKGLFR